MSKKTAEDLLLEGGFKNIQGKIFKDDSRSATWFKPLLLKNQIISGVEIKNGAVSPMEFSWCRTYGYEARSFLEDLSIETRQKIKKEISEYISEYAEQLFGDGGEE